MAEIESEKFIQFISGKWQGRACPMCGAGPWSVQDRTFQLAEFHHGNLVVGGPVIPVVPVSCGNCGYTVLVNAIIAGVMKSAPVEPEKKP